MSFPQAATGGDSLGVVCQDIRKNYVKRNGEQLEVLRDVSLSIRHGEFVALVGASGSGKSTLLRIVAGLEVPDGGKVSTDDPGNGDARVNTATVFQADALLPWRSVLGNIELGLEADGSTGRKARHKRARELCESVGLKGFEEARPYEISGGMRQRVNLARALAVEPDVLLMDEPFAALDAQTREIMQQQLLKIWDKRKKTVLFVTHQMDEAVYLADRVIVLRSKPGRVGLDLAVPFARPRALELKREPAFTEVVERIWAEIKDDVMSGIEAFI